MEVHIEHVQLESIQEANDHISTLQVSNNIFVLGFESGQLVVIDLDKPSVINRFKLPLLQDDATQNSELGKQQLLKKNRNRKRLHSHHTTFGEQLLSSWINPDGTKLFVKTSFAKYYLLDIAALQEGATNCLYAINRFAKKNFDVDVVYWYSPLAFVCCSTSGYIYSLDFEANLGNPKIVGCSNNFIVKGKKKVGGGVGVVVDGILFDPEQKNMLLATRNKLMYWRKSENSKFDIESPLDYLTKNILPNETEEFNHLQERSFEGNDPACRFASINGHKFAWLTNSGVVYGDISPRSNVLSSSSVLSDAKILLDMELPPVVMDKPRMSDSVMSHAESVATSSTEAIKDVVLTDFHMVILRDSTITVINQLTNRVVFQEVIIPVSATNANSNSSSNSNLHEEIFLGLAMDNQTKTLWCYSTTNVYEIILSNESKVIWKILCSQGDYDTALNLKGLSSWELDEVLYRKGESLLAKGQLLEAAKCYGQATSLNIGSIALKFLTKADESSEDNYNDKDNDNNDDNDKNEHSVPDMDYNLAALQEYLIRTLSTIKGSTSGKGSSNDKDFQRTTQILLSSWIVFNFMKQLNNEDQLNKSNLADGSSSRKSKSQLQKNFERFLADNRDCLDDKTIYQIISSQNRKSDLLFFAQLIKDYEYIISYWIKQENWYEALRVLLQFHDPATVYKYSTILLVNSPEATVNSWMKIPNLNPTNLLQAILTYFTNYQRTLSLSTGSNNNNHNKNQGTSLETSTTTAATSQTANPLPPSTPVKNYGLLYLIWYVESHSDKQQLPTILYNTVLYMMITGAPPSLPLSPAQTVSPGGCQTTIIEFLETYYRYCDLDFILRLSLRYKRHDVSIHLLTRLKLYEDAINLAIENDMTEDAKYVIRQIGKSSAPAAAAAAVSAAGGINGSTSSSGNMTNDTRLQRRLWLKVSKYLLSSNGVDIKQVTRTILAESDGLIEIRDLLPLYSEVATVANIKDELIRDLEGHSERMSRIAVDIRNSIKLKQKMKADIGKFEKRYSVLEPGVSCSHCHKFLQDRKFFVFPCDHCYHKNCLVELILHSNDYNLINELQQLMKKVQEEKNENKSKKKKQQPRSALSRTLLLQSSSSSSSNSLGSRSFVGNNSNHGGGGGDLNSNGFQNSDNEAEGQLEKFLSGKCYICSDMNINKIDDPLELDDVELQKWRL